MEHERCFIYEPSATEERAPKRQRTDKHDPRIGLPARIQVYRDLWARQEERIQNTLEEADRAVQENISAFISSSQTSQGEPGSTIPAALIVAGPSIASHGPFFQRLGRKIKSDANCAYVVLTSGECPNLKSLLKQLIKKATSRVDDDNDDEDRPSASSRFGPKLLNYDLGHVQEWQKQNHASSIVIAIQDSEAFDTGLLNDFIDLLRSWLDRLPFVLLFGLATSAESFEDRLTGASLRALQGEKFDVTQSDEIIEKLFKASVASTDIPLRIGPNLCRRILDRQKDHLQNTQDFSDGLKYAYMSHFYASVPSIILKEGLSKKDLTSETYEAIRNLPSFRRWIEVSMDCSPPQVTRDILESDDALFEQIQPALHLGQEQLATQSHAVHVLSTIRESLQMTPNVRLPAIWTRSIAGELDGSPLLRETMLNIKKIPSDKFVTLLASLIDLVDDQYFPIKISSMQAELDTLLQNKETAAPLRTEHDARTDSVRTTVVAQKVLLSKHKAALSEQDRKYSDLVGGFHTELEMYFDTSFGSLEDTFLSEVLVYDLKSPHTEVFQPKPRFAIERALASPHDYLGCECCSRVDGKEGALSAAQPATAIVYQMFLESGSLINVSDLQSAFNALIGEGEEDEESQAKTNAQFQRALAELKYLGLVKPSRKKTDHIAKVMWKGL